MRRTIVVLLILAAATPAQAGGSWFQFEDREYQPGEFAEAVEALSWRHDEASYRAEDPFLLWLVPAEVGISRSLVGFAKITTPVHLTSIDGSLRLQTATARLEIPQLPPGTYGLDICRARCGLVIGDIMGGSIRIGPGNGGRTPSQIAEEIRARLSLGDLNVDGPPMAEAQRTRPILDQPPTPLRPQDSQTALTLWAAASAGVALSLVLFGLWSLALRMKDTRRSRDSDGEGDVPEMMRLPPAIADIDYHVEEGSCVAP